MSSTLKNTNRSNRKLTFQTLESRQLMAGNVAVAVINGDLVVKGDAKANDVAIFQTMQQGKVVRGSYYISGLNGTTINGTSGSYFTGVNHDFKINMGQGDDHLAIGNMNEFNPNLTNASFIVPHNLSVTLGNNNNTLEIKGITVGNNTSIVAGSGNNAMGIRGDFGVPINVLNHPIQLSPLAPISHGDLTIQAGGGNNQLNMGSSSVLHNMNVKMGLGWSGSDTVYMDSVTVHGSMGLRTGGIGGDVLNFVQLNHLTVDHTLSLAGGVDHGYWWIENSHVDTLIATLEGHGPLGNSLWLDHVDGRQATLDGGPSGHNELYTRDANFTNEQITRFQTQGAFTG
jgi:hypothetical protein